MTSIRTPLETWGVLVQPPRGFPFSEDFLPSPSLTLLRDVQSTGEEQVSLYRESLSPFPLVTDIGPETDAVPLG